jgi:AcrR family transcriptional regulator
MPAEPQPAAPDGLTPRDSRTENTRRRLLDATFQRLAREGYASLSLREIGRDAGINHALISYHFGSKDDLVIAVLDDLNARLLDRQKRLYEKPGAFADKWRQAVRFYDVDLGSGFVRVLIELYAASLSNPELRAAFKPRIRAWYDVIRGACTEAIDAYGLQDVITPEVAAAWICHFWIGMELSMLAGFDDSEIGHRAALRAFEALLRRLDARHASPPRR